MRRVLALCLLLAPLASGCCVAGKAVEIAADAAIRTAGKASSVALDAAFSSDDDDARAAKRAQTR